jgi:hypothetical protein
MAQDTQNDLLLATPSRNPFSAEMSGRLSEMVMENYRKLYPNNNVAEANKLKNAKLFMNNYGAAKQHSLFNEDIDDLFDEKKFANTMRRY